MNFEQRAQAVADEVVKLLAKKQADYGPENILAFEEFGVLVRATDKLSRLKNLVCNGKEAEVDESIEDTWADLAGYSIIALMLRKKTFQEDLDEQTN